MDTLKCALQTQGTVNNHNDDGERNFTNYMFSQYEMQLAHFERAFFILVHFATVLVQSTRKMTWFAVMCKTWALDRSRTALIFFPISTGKRENLQAHVNPISKV